MSIGNPHAVPSAATSVRWSVFTLAFVTSFLLYVHRYMFSFLKPTLSREWNLTNTELGAIDSAFSTCYTIFQFPVAAVADGLGVHLVLPILMTVWVSGLAVMACAPSPLWIWYALALLGTGQSAVYACLNRIARMWFPPAIRTTLQGLVGIFAGRLGALSSSLLFASLLLGVWGLNWRTVLWFQVAVGLIHLCLFVSLYRDSPRQHPRVNAAEVRLIEGVTSDVAHPNAVGREPVSLMRMLRSISPRSLLNLGFLSLQSLLSTFADNVYSNWIPQFLSQVHGLQFKQMGVYASLPLLCGAVAGILGGVLNDYLIAVTGNRRWSRVAVAAAGKSIAAFILLLALNSYDRPYSFCVYLFFVKLFGDCSLTTAWGAVSDMGGRTTASVFALTNSIAGLGQIAAPVIFGMVADRFGWKAVFMTVVVTYLLCAVTWLFINCTIPVMRDIESEGGANECSRSPGSAD